MAVIMTKRNMVCALEPLPDDSFVLTYLSTPEERWVLITRPIDGYQASVDWAVGMADQMACPISIVPMTAEEFAQHNRQKLARQDAADRQLVLTTLWRLVRESNTREERDDALQLLRELGELK